MKSCWDIEPEDRPRFRQLVTSLEKVVEDDTEGPDRDPGLGEKSSRCGDTYLPKGKVKIKNEKENKYDNEHLHGKYRKKKKTKKYEN